MKEDYAKRFKINTCMITNKIHFSISHDDSVGTNSSTDVTDHCLLSVRSACLACFCKHTECKTYQVKFRIVYWFFSSFKDLNISNTFNEYSSHNIYLCLSTDLLLSLSSL